MLSDIFGPVSSYLLLFIVTFLSSSIVPLTSEFFLIGMQREGFNVWNILAIASFGNYIGSLTTYLIGRYGASGFIERRVKPSPKRMEQARTFYSSWGSPILFFSFVPLIGDALTFLAGVVKSNLWTFTFWVALGKWVRFALVLGAVSSFWDLPKP